MLRRNNFSSAAFAPGKILRHGSAWPLSPKSIFSRIPGIEWVGSAQGSEVSDLR
jgi:hypothetical protein